MAAVTLVAAGVVFRERISSAFSPQPSVEAVLPVEALVAKSSNEALEPVETETPDARTEANVVIQITSNARDRMRVTVRNDSTQPVRLDLKAGELYENGQNRMVLLQPGSIKVAAGECKQEELRAAAASLANELGEGVYTRSPAAIPTIETLVGHIEKHPDISPEVVQTAVLALTDNAPLEAFAKFPQLQSDLPTRFDSALFKVDTSQIISTLLLLRELNILDPNLALASDSQLKIESMLDPRSHELAKRYYGIQSQAEWGYWQRELLQGNPGTRHYALFGIARYFPDVALQMMPKWAREKRIKPVFRISAIRALAVTHRPEAGPILRELQKEFGEGTELGNAAALAAQSVEAQPGTGEGKGRE